MKPSRVRPRLTKRSSFTLVELLVVIGIIAILASVLQTAGLMAIRMAYRAKAATMANQIQTACMSYYAEYSIYPLPTQGTPADVYYGSSDITDWSNLTVALCGNVDPYNGTAVAYTTVTNSRGVAFLSLKATDVDANGIPLNPIHPTSVGNYFNIAINGTYNGLLGSANGETYITNFATTLMPQTTITQGVMVWGNCNTGTYTNNNNYVHAP